MFDLYRITFQEVLIQLYIERLHLNFVYTYITLHRRVTITNRIKKRCIKSYYEKKLLKLSHTVYLSEVPRSPARAQETSSTAWSLGSQCLSLYSHR